MKGPRIEPWGTIVSAVSFPTKKIVFPSNTYHTQHETLMWEEHGYIVKTLMCLMWKINVMNIKRNEGKMSF